jgi:hypothetical protein
VAGDQVIDITVVSNSSETRSTYITELYDVEDVGSSTKLSTTTLVILMLLISFASMTCAYTAIWCYYKRKGRLPCFDRTTEEEARPFAVAK